MFNNRLARGTASALALSCIAWLGAGTVGGQTPLTCDLANCIRKALEANPNLAVARIEVEAADAAIRKEKSAMRPELGLTLTASEINGEPVGPFAVLGVDDPEVLAERARYGEAGAFTIDLNYPLYSEGAFLGLDSPAVASAVSLKEQEIWTSKAAIEEVTYGVAEGFFAALSKREMIVLSEEDLRIARERLAVVEREVSLHLKPDSESELARAQLSVSEEKLAYARRDFEMALTHLARLVGFQSPRDIALDHSPPSVPDLPPLENLLEAVRQTHPDLAIQRANAERLRAELALVRSERWPSLFLESSYTYADDFSPPGSKLFQAQLRLEMPLADFGERRASVVESELRWRAEEERIKAIEHAVVDELVRTYSDIQSFEGEVSVLRREYVQAEVDLKYMRARQNQGLAGPLAVLGSEGRLLDVKKSLAEANYNLFVGLAGLQKASGGAWKWMP